VADSCIWIEVTPQDFSRGAQLRLVYSNTKRETSWTALGQPTTVTTGAPATLLDQLPEVGVVLPARATVTHLIKLFDSHRRVPAVPQAPSATLEECVQ